MGNEPSEDPIELLAQIGKVTVLWAKMEGILDSIVAAIYFQGGGNTLEATLPRALDRKLEFLRKAHKTLEELASIRAEADTLIDAAHKLKQRRHDIIHGFADDLSENGLSIRVLKHDKSKPRGFSFDRQTVTPDDLSDLFTKIGELFDLADNHFYATMTALFGEQDGNAESGIPH